MDHRIVFSTLEAVCVDTISAISGNDSLLQNEATPRLLATVRQIQEHSHALKALVAGFSAVYHHFDFDAETPGNGYRTLVKAVHSCVLYIIHKGRYIASNCGGVFFRVEHNACEMEAYCTALCQLRALFYLAQQLLNDNEHGQLYSQDESLSERFVKEYTSMHKACFYGRCLGFQFSPSLKPFLQTVVISMVSFGENYNRQQTRLGRAAVSFLTSGKYVMDPELRGKEFERITQNLDMQFWKTFWNITETELISGLTRITSCTVQVNLTLAVPGEPLSLPLASDPNLSVSVSPPVAHWGPGPVRMRLISHSLREGQDSAELLAFSQSEGPPLSLPPVRFRPQRAPLSKWLLIHFHGGGFVAQTSKSHESYLKSWSRDLNVPILSVDYSLAPEAPFPRALEECFYAYCWALQNCHLLGSTADRVCLAGDSAGGNLCITVSMKAMSHGVRIPDGIMAAYPATLLTTDASPSRLLTLIDPLLPLSVLYKCINAYTGTDSETVQPRQQLDTLSALGRDTALLLGDIRQGASSWLQSLLDRTSSQLPATTTTSRPQKAAPSSDDTPEDHMDFPDGFEPLRSGCLAEIRTPCTAIMKNPFVSPLLAPDSLLKGLPPVHLVASALDALLDDSVMFAKKLRSLEQRVTLTVIEDLPHGFLSLSQLSKETQEASDICVGRIREVFEQDSTCP